MSESNYLVQLEQMPGTASVMLEAAFKGSSYKLGDEVPNIVCEVPAAKVDQAHLAKFRALCGYSDSQLIPPAYFNLYSNPLFMKIMAHRAFPLRAMGQVYLINAVEVFQPLDVQAAYSWRAELTGTRLTGSGLEWNADISAMIDGKLAWRAQATTLYRCKTDVPRQPKPEVVELDHIEQWQVPANTGRQFAKISGDYNPIHLYPLTAKLLGFKRAIAHGLWSKSRSLAVLESQLPEAGYRAESRFLRPVFLPSEVRFSWRREEGGIEYALFNQAGDQAHLSGTVTME